MQLFHLEGSGEFILEELVVRAVLDQDVADAADYPGALCSESASALTKPSRTDGTRCLNVASTMLWRFFVAAEQRSNVHVCMPRAQRSAREPGRARVRVRFLAAHREEGLRLLSAVVARQGSGSLNNTHHSVASQ